MSDTGAGLGKVVVNRAMSVDGFIAGPDHAMDWVFEYMREDTFPEVMAATGAMLVGRGTHEVAKRMSEEDTDYDGGRCSSSRIGHRMSRSEGSHSSAATSQRPSPRRVLSRAGRIWRSSVRTWPVSACSEVSSTRSWCMSCLCCSATACASRPRASAGSTWNHSATRSPDLVTMLRFRVRRKT